MLALSFGCPTAHAVTLPPATVFYDMSVYDSVIGATPLPGGGSLEKIVRGGAGFPLAAAYLDSLNYDSGTVNSLTPGGGSTDITNLASIRADLASGRFGNSSESSFAHLGAGTVSASSYSALSYSDTFAFSVAGAGLSTVTYVDLKLSLHGTTEAAPDSVAFTTVSLGLSEIGVGTGDASITHACDVGACNATPFNGFSPAVGYNATVTAGTGGQPDSISVEVPLVGATPTVSFTFELSTSTKGNGSNDYSHTAAFGLSAPAGVSYTTASGLFLSAPVTEPPPALLVVAGVGLVLLRAKRLALGERSA